MLSCRTRVGPQEGAAGSLEQVERSPVPPTPEDTSRFIDPGRVGTGDLTDRSLLRSSKERAVWLGVSLQEEPSGSESPLLTGGVLRVLSLQEESSESSPYRRSRLAPSLLSLQEEPSGSESPYRRSRLAPSPLLSNSDLKPVLTHPSLHWCSSQNRALL